MPGDAEDTLVQICELLESSRRQVEVSVATFRAGILNNGINVLAVTVDADFLEAPAALSWQVTVLLWILYIKGGNLSVTDSFCKSATFVYHGYNVFAVTFVFPACSNGFSVFNSGWNEPSSCSPVLCPVGQRLAPHSSVGKDLGCWSIDQRQEEKREKKHNGAHHDDYEDRNECECICNACDVDLCEYVYVASHRLRKWKEERERERERPETNARNW